MQSKVLIAVDQAENDRQVLPLWRALETAIVSDMVPLRKQWGRSAGKYPGEHIVT